MTAPEAGFMPGRRELLARKVLRLDGPFCCLCALPLPDPDAARLCRVVPRNLGGGDGLQNLRLACPACAAARPRVTAADLAVMLRDVPGETIGRMFRRESSLVVWDRCNQLARATTGAQARYGWGHLRPVFSEAARFVVCMFAATISGSGGAPCAVPSCEDWEHARVRVTGLRHPVVPSLGWTLTLCMSHARMGVSGQLVDVRPCLAVLEGQARNTLYPEHALALLALAEEVRGRLGLDGDLQRTAAVVPSETCAPQR